MLFGNTARTMRIPKDFIRKFISYFFVGGSAAIVEWITFFICSSILGLFYLLSTFLAFCIATATNWFLGRTFTFKDSKKFKYKKSKELSAIFFVSFVCLLINFLVMFILVQLCGFTGNTEKIVCKIFATGVAFIGNFSLRVFFVYSEKE